MPEGGRAVAGGSGPVGGRGVGLGSGPVGGRPGAAAGAAKIPVVRGRSEPVGEGLPGAGREPVGDGASIAWFIINVLRGRGGAPG